MKKLIISMLVMSIIASIFVSAVGADVQECLDAGFDFYIEKFQCGDTSPETDNPNWAITVDWTGTDNDCTSVDWTANPAVAGVTEKAGTNAVVTHPGGTSGTIDKTYKQAISHVTFCGNENEIPEFTTIGAALVLAGAGFYMYRKRSRK